MTAGWFWWVRKKEWVLRKHIQTLRKSGLFDERWYLRRYPEVAQSALDPIEHYLRFGVLESKNPSVRFDTRSYLDANRDVAKSGMNPLLHYVLYGRREGRMPIPCLGADCLYDERETLDPARELWGSRVAYLDLLKAENERLRKVIAEQETEIKMNLVQLRSVQEELENWFRQYLELKRALEAAAVSPNRDVDE